MDKVLITGQSGFIGQHITAQLSRAGYDVYDLGCDLLEANGVKHRLCDVNPHFVIHLAARTEVEKSFGDPLSFSSINYVGTVNLVEVCREVSNLKLFVFASTMETYGWQPISDRVENGDEVDTGLAFDEMTTQNPNAPYAVAKLGCEKYLEYAGRAYNMPWTILRQTNSYGRYDNDFFVVERIISQMLSGEVCRLGDPLPFRNFLFIDDLVDLYVRVLEQYEAARHEVFCTGPPNTTQIRQLAETISRLTGFKGDVVWGTRPRRVGEIYYLNSSHKKAESVLGWSPVVDLQDGLNRTIQMWRENANSP